MSKAKRESTPKNADLHRRLPFFIEERRKAKVEGELFAIGVVDVLLVFLQDAFSVELLRCRRHALL